MWYTLLEHGFHEGMSMHASPSRRHCPWNTPPRLRHTGTGTMKYTHQHAACTCATTPCIKHPMHVPVDTP